MANIIAVIWDFDKTLVNGYMQDPIFKKYHVDSIGFWRKVNGLPDFYKQQGVRTNPDTIYLNHFIACAQSGEQFDGLNNAMLRDFGKEQCFYAGIPEIFKKTMQIIEENPVYQEYGIRVEHYIVSTGFAEIIRGSSVMDYVKYIWGCEVIEHEIEGKKVLGEIGYTIDNTTKTRAIFEINKGTPVNKIDVNSKMSEEMRRVRFENMIYIADGPSDIPAFSLVNKNGGSTFAVYPHGDEKAFHQVEQMRMDGRINMYAEADYSEGTTAYMWITNKIKEYADRMQQVEKKKVSESTSAAPHHLTE